MSYRTGGLSNGSPGVGRSEREYDPYKEDKPLIHSSGAGYNSARERRTGGYGYLYEGASQSTTSLHSASSGNPASRPRTRDGDGGRALLGGNGSDSRYGDRSISRERERARPDGPNGVWSAPNTDRDGEQIDGMSAVGAPIYEIGFLGLVANNPTRL